MSDFCISINGSAINKIVNTAFQNEKIQARLKGTETIDLGGATTKVAWEITSTPAVDLKDIDPQTEVISGDGTPLTIHGDLFQISSKLKMMLDDKPESTSELPFTVVVSAALIGKNVSFKVEGIMVSLYSGLDKMVVKLIAPKLVQSINETLGFKPGSEPPHIFSLRFLESIGVTADRYDIGKYNCRINIWGTIGRDNPLTGKIPNDGKDIALILSPAMQKIIMEANFSKAEGTCSVDQEIDKTTKVGFLGHFGVRAKVHVAVDKLICKEVKNNTICMALKPKFSFSGEAVLFGADIGAVEYDCSLNPEFIGTNVDIEMKGKDIHCELNHFESFTVLLTPTGKWYKQVSSGILWPLSEAIINFITGVIPSVITVPFSIQVPDVNVKLLDSCNMNLQISDLSNDYSDNEMIVQANIATKIEG